jgi:hypothetical protein
MAIGFGLVTTEFQIRAFPFPKTGSKVWSGGVGRDPNFLFPGHLIRNKNHEGAKNKESCKNRD